MKRRMIPIHSSLNRSNLFAGGERELVLFTGLIAFAMIFVALSWFSVIFGVVLWSGVLVVLRMMAKADPVMSKVYLRHIRYKRFYPARATPYAPSASHKRNA